MPFFAVPRLPIIPATASNPERMSIFGVPTFRTIQFYTLSELVRWYDFCLPRHGITMMANETSFQIDLREQTDVFEINPGTVGHLQVHSPRWNHPHNSL